MANGIGTGSSSFRPATAPATGVKAAPDVLTPPPPGITAAPPGGIPGFGNIQGAGFSAGPTGFVTPTGDRPGAPTATTGQGGFSASPRLLSNFEINQLSQELGLQGVDRLGGPQLRTRQQLGPFGFIADPSASFNLRREAPLIETRLNFENLLQAQQDRESALQLLQGQRDVIGQGADQQLALDVARRRLESPEPFSPEEVALQTGQIRSRAARGLEAGQRQFEESFAAQGLAGSGTSFQGAQLQQAADRQASDELSRLAIENALGRDVNEAQALDRLRGITGEDELRQIALNQAISELLTASRGQFDLSALAGGVRKPDQGALSRIGFF